MSIIGQCFDVELSQLSPLIKRADRIALATEKRDLMPHSTESWIYLQGISPLPEVISPLPPVEAKTAYLAAFYTLRPNP